MRVNDLVTRHKYGNDIVFKITKIENNIAYLKGEVIRLFADAELSDLTRVEVDDSLKNIPSFAFKKESGQINGKILHIDGDEYYLNKAMEYYKKANVSCVGYFIREQNVGISLKNLLNEHHPDILVITGHDAYDGKEIKNLGSYRTSKYFIDAINIARTYQSNKDGLAIIAGACQSNFEALISAGANFASSPKRENIHLLDPVIIAINLALALVDEYNQPEDLVKKTVTKSLGGIQTKGFARRIYIGG